MIENQSILTKKNKILFSIGAIISGLLLSAFAWNTIAGNPAGPICFLSGLGLSSFGLIFLIMALTKRTR